MKKLFIALSVLVSSACVIAQESKVKLHSHNDYQQTLPFWNAYTNGLESIEIDLVLVDGKLYVAHEKQTIHEHRTIENLYLKPLVQAQELAIGKGNKVQFLLDLKSNAKASLEVLVPVLEKYKDFIEEHQVAFVLSGSKPDADYFKTLPGYIKIDHQKLDKLEDSQMWDRVAMVSLSFRDFSVWNGKGRMVEAERQAVQQIIDKVHAMGKPIRFWATPDGKTAWKAFMDMGIDYINTDKPYEVKKYMDHLPNYIYTNAQSTAVYKPTFKSDDKNSKIKNVILLIGDGNGLTQISAAALANGGDLTMLQLKQMGLIKTQAADDFTTDSAAGGTAIATGEKSYNRSIGMSMQRKPLENMTELLSKYDFSTAVLTTDEVIGATPSAFYAHQLDRDDNSLIAKDLLNSEIDVFVGGGKKAFKDVAIDEAFTLLGSVDQIGNSSADRIGVFLAEAGLPGVINGRDDVLARATKETISFLQAKDKPFFMLVEGAKIDSYGHFNNTGGIVTEGIDFDKAVAEAIKFADKDGQTLVVVTADHETGGFAIPQGNVEKGFIEGDFISNDHSGAMVPIFAYGPKSSEFRGVYENNEVFHKIIKLLKIKQK